MRSGTIKCGFFKSFFLFGMVCLSACAVNDRPYSPDLQHFEPTHQYTADVDMYISPSLETYTENQFFKDGLEARQPVPGTIPRGFMPYPYANDTAGYRLAGLELKNPIEPTEAGLAKGKDLFTKFCVHCHGDGGNADGPMIKNGKFPPPPSFLTGNSSGGGALMDLPEGKMFHSITYGKNMMGSHAGQLSLEERWMIVMHIKSLQAAARAATANGAANTSEYPTGSIAEPTTPDSEQ